jgi:paraquat-inducible protein B
MSESDGPASRVPASRVVPRKRTRLSIVWLIPIVAAVAGAWVAVTRILSEGPAITIVLSTAEGLEAGKTKIEYDGVQLGTVTDIRLNDDHQKVIATAQMTPETKEFLVEDTKFWIVRPRISGGTVSGLGTLISGAFIGMDIGKSKKARRDFEALEIPPVVTGDVVGRLFVLETPDLGSIDTGTPIFFRRLKVGKVASYKLEEDGRSFRVKAFVQAPYDQYVTPDTRFWHASGIDLSLGASGLSVRTESLDSVLVGGLAFETPANGPVLPPAEADTTFTLFENRVEAFRPAAGHVQTYVVVFSQEVRGLEKGAPVDFRGIRIGEVTNVDGRVDTNTFNFTVRVTIELDAERFGVQALEIAPGKLGEAARRKLVDALVAHGVRAQLRTGSLLTGALYVALDFFPNAPPKTVDWSQQPVELPTQPGQLEAVEASIARVLEKVEKFPFETIGQDLRKTIVEFDATLASARGALDNAGTLVEPNSALGQQLEGTLQEVSGAARSVRVLADFLERHPEALIQGKTAEGE